MSLLQVKNISKAYGGVQALSQVSFELPRGQMLALLGTNGAGKSTCFNLLNGQLRPDSGAILFDGRPIGGKTPRAIWRLGIGRTFQIAATFASMTVLENVQMALLSRERKLLRFWQPAAAYYRDEAMALLAQVGMQDQSGRACNMLAYGDIKRAELAIALANRPALLLMDEPAAGMAQQERYALMALTRKLVTENNLAVLFTEHSMDVVFAFADRMIVLARGELIAAGDGATIRNDPKVQAVYFGSGRTFEKAGTAPMADTGTQHEATSAGDGNAA